MRPADPEPTFTKPYTNRMNSVPFVPLPVNEPVLAYAPGSPERAQLLRELERQASEVVDIPLFIGGEEVRTGDTVDVVMPHDHGHALAKVHKAGPTEIARAVAAAVESRREWAAQRWDDRASVFVKAAELAAGPFRATLNAATMLGQSKTVHQAEIDAACEVADFFRFAPAHARQLYEMQPISKDGAWNHAEYRALEGFVYAISPFNFTAIGANLAGVPALVGNACVWKPAFSAMLSAYYLMRLYGKAGLPPGVINMVAGDPVAITRDVLESPALAGIHFTGSTAVFNSLWREVGARIDSYDTYPRLVGETGGKNFVLVHPDSDARAVRTALVRGAFEYQGQKCSAASRAYIPASMWRELEPELVRETESLTMGDPGDLSNFVAAVIDRKAFDKISGYIERARDSEDAEIVAGGSADGTKGWFVQPTVIRSYKPDFETMCDEIFGPVLTVYVFEDEDWDETVRTVERTSNYALTGAVFARDRRVVRSATDALRDAAGNFYVNDKPTGAVVGQQPFGGSRGSGTNDKAGSLFNILRWVSARTIKETFVPATDYRYPFMEGEGRAP